MPKRLLRTESMLALAGLLAVGLAGPVWADPALTAPSLDGRSDRAAVPAVAQSEADKDHADEDGADKDGADKDGADKDGADKDGADKDGADRASPVPAASAAETDMSVDALRKAWMETRKKIFAGKHQVIPDSEDTDTVNHLNWYEATGYTRPYPGEDTVRPPTDFPNRFREKRDDDGD